MLPELLQKLAHEVIELIEKQAGRGTLQKVQRMYIKHEIKEFTYNEGSISFMASFPTVIKDEWDWKSLSELMNEARNLPIYKKCYQVIADEYGVSESQAEYWLSRFVMEFIVRYLNNNIDSGKIIDLIFTFIGDLEDTPKKWKIETWLRGVWLEVNEINIGKGIVIRRPQPSDFEYERPLDFYPVFEQPIIEHPSAILEIHKRLKIKPYIYDEHEKLIILLQLYKLGSVSIIQTRWKAKSILQKGGGTSRPLQMWTTTYKYSLTKEDEDNLLKFVNGLLPLLPTDEYGRPLPSDPIGIAILRYQDALLKPETIENKIAYGIMGLEALYLKAREREELSHRLAQRIAKIFGAYGEPPVKIYNLIKEGYEIRSCFVHGSPLHSENPQKMKNLLDNILELLRKSIFIFLQVKKEKEKDEFLGLIDNALLDNQAFEKLENVLSKYVK